MEELRKVRFPVGQLDVEAYYLSSTEYARWGANQGVRPNLTNVQIRQKTKALRYENLEARRPERLHSTIIIYKGNNAFFAVRFSSLETS